MKKYLTTTFAFIAAMLCCKICFAKDITAKVVLTQHKWTLVEIIQNDRDSLTNLTLFLTPCEKDNFINYAGNGTYQIHEGSEKCSTDDIKGEGTWSYNAADSTLMDSYEGGRKVSKKVLTLSDGVFRIQYYGEAKKQYTLTYFSEEGQKDDANKDLIFDNSDASQNITKLIKDYLFSANYYVLPTRKDFQIGTPSAEDDKNGIKPTVFVMPFSDATKQVVNATDRNTQLMAQAKKSGIDYVITGDIKSVEPKLNDKKQYTSSVKYDLYIVDVANGKVATKTVDSDKPDKPKKAGINWNTVLIVAAAVLAVGVFTHPSYYGYNRYYGYGYYGYGYHYGYSPYNYYYNRDYYYTYNSLFLANTVANVAATTAATAAVFNAANNTERSDIMKKNSANIEAINKTSDGVLNFVAANTAPQIKINSFDGSGAKARMIIEAGSNIGLDKGDKLSVMQTTGTGEFQLRKEIGIIEVENLTQSSSGAYCKLGKGKSDVLKAYKDAPGSLMVMPQLKKQEKDKDDKDDKN